MTIEAKLDALTAAINNLTWAINGKQTAATDSKPEKASKVEAPKAETPPPADKPKVEAPKAETPPPADKPKAEPVSYDVLRQAFLDAYKKDTAKAMAVLSAKGLASAKEAKPEQYADLVAELSKVAA